MMTIPPDGTPERARTDPLRPASEQLDAVLNNLGIAWEVTEIASSPRDREPWVILHRDQLEAILQSFPAPAVSPGVQAQEESRAYLCERLRQIADYHIGLTKYAAGGWHDDTAITLREAAVALASPEREQLQKQVEVDQAINIHLHRQMVEQGLRADRTEAEREALQQQIAALDLKWAAASEFIRDVLEAVGQPQPELEGIVNLSELRLIVVGHIEELKEEAETQQANCLVEDQLRSSADAALTASQTQLQALVQELRKRAEDTPYQNISTVYEYCAGKLAALIPVPPPPQEPT